MKYTYVIRIVAGLALMGGVMVLSGWVLDISVLKSVIPNEVDVQPSAALCFVCGSVAMYLLTVKRTGMANAVFILACALLILMGGLTVLDFFTGYDTGYDNLFKPFIHQAFSQIPLRMSPGSAMSFLLLGPGFLLINSTKSYWQRTGQFLLHVVTLIAILAIFSYLYSVPYQGRIAIGSPMALRTSLSLLFISTVSTLLNPRWGITGTMTGSKMGDMMARRLLPLTLLAIFAIGYLRLQSMRLHLVSDKSAIVLVFVSIFLIALFVILNTAGALNRIDIQRLLAKDEVDSLNKDLESTNDELRLAMQKLELNNQYLEQLAYISAHDIKSPILTLKGLVDVIEKENAVNKEYEPMLKMVTSTIDQMQRTNNALNSILKLRQNLLNTDVRPAEEHSLKTIMQDVETTLRPQIEAADAIMEMDIEALSETGFPYVHLKSVFYNLISNALKYRDAERQLIIKLGAKQMENRDIVFYVEDNGLGMDIERNRDKLFGIFKRFHDHVEGSGVGLHIVKSIVEAYGGNITVSSQPGKGTRFTITMNNLILAQ